MVRDGVEPPQPKAPDLQSGGLTYALLPHLKYPKGLEPLAPALVARRSTIELEVQSRSETQF